MAKTNAIVHFTFRLQCFFVLNLSCVLLNCWSRARTATNSTAHNTQLLAFVLRFVVWSFHASSCIRACQCEMGESAQKGSSALLLSVRVALGLSFFVDFPQKKLNNMSQVWTERDKKFDSFEEGLSESENQVSCMRSSSSSVAGLWKTASVARGNARAS